MPPAGDARPHRSFEVQSRWPLKVMRRITCPAFGNVARVCAPNLPPLHPAPPGAHPSG